MKLNDYTAQPELWDKAGIKRPQFDKEALIKATESNPQWVHFGAGNIFRAFTGRVAQTLIHEGRLNTGIIVGEGFDYEIIEKAYHPYHNNSLLVTLKADASVDLEVIASVTHSYRGDAQFASEWAGLKAAIVKPSLQMISFTITEKGYSVKAADGSFIAPVATSVEKPMDQASNFLCKLVYLLSLRFEANQQPIALVSMDNCSQNGDLLKAAVLAIAKAYRAHGHATQAFVDYLEDPKKVSYPLSMIDKITPRPDQDVAKILADKGFEDTQTIITKFNTYTAPFVNAEETEYLVIEDDFPNGRPDLATKGVYLANRETVEKSEKMKVGTCLNPLHTALAVLGCVLGYEKISDEMQNPDLVKLISLIGYKEGLPVVVDPKILDPKTFIDQVITQRFPNPYMPDTPQRIATDTSQKIPVRFMETVRLYLERDDLEISSLEGIPFVVATWIRYLMGVDDQGQSFERSPDPLFEVLDAKLDGLTLGDQEDHVRRVVKSILAMKEIFLTDLYKIGLGEKIEAYTIALTRSPGAIAKTLKEVVS